MALAAQSVGQWVIGQVVIQGLGRHLYPIYARVFPEPWA